MKAPNIISLEIYICFNSYFRGNSLNISFFFVMKINDRPACNCVKFCTICNKVFQEQSNYIITRKKVCFRKLHYKI